MAPDDTPTGKKFGQLLGELRREFKFDLSALGALAGISLEQLEKVESGTCRPPRQTVFYDALKVLGVPEKQVAGLLFGTEDAPRWLIRAGSPPERPGEKLVIEIRVHAPGIRDAEIDELVTGIMQDLEERAQRGPSPERLN